MNSWDRCLRIHSPIMTDPGSDSREPAGTDRIELPGPPLPLHSISRDEEGKRYCWVCLATEEDDTIAPWVQPCRCKGTTKWVHQTCLQRWVDEKRKDNSNNKVSCPQCNTEYLIVFPNMGLVVHLLDSLDSIVYRTCPILAGTIVIGSVYWSAVTHGAVTVMLVMGCDAGLDMLESRDPLILLVGLPVIPVVLILSKMVQWEERVLMFLRNNSSKVPLMRHIMPSFLPPERPQYSVEVPPLTDPVCTTRLLCSALFMPSIAKLVGRMFFDSVQTNWQRTLLGGITFIAIKGILKIYLKQQQYVRQCQRQILDYTDVNVSRGTQPHSSRGSSAPTTIISPPPVRAPSLDMPAQNSDNR